MKKGITDIANAQETPCGKGWFEMAPVMPYYSV